MCRIFLKHCTLTKKAPDEIWRCDEVLGICPLWLLVRTPTTLGPYLAYKWMEYSLLLWMSLDVILISTISCVIYFYDYSVWNGCWSLCHYLKVYKCMYVCPFCSKTIAGSVKVRPLNLRMTVVAPAGRPKLFPCSVFVLLRLCIVWRLSYDCIRAFLGLFMRILKSFPRHIFTVHKNFNCPMGKIIDAFFGYFEHNINMCNIRSLLWKVYSTASVTATNHQQEWI